MTDFLKQKLAILTLKEELIVIFDQIIWTNDLELNLAKRTEQYINLIPIFQSQFFNIMLAVS